MLTIVAMLASLVFIGWIVYRAVRQKPIRAHTVTRVLAYVVGIYTFAFFLSMDIPQLIQVIVSILLGAALIVIAAFLQRSRQQSRQEFLLQVTR